MSELEAKLGEVKQSMISANRSLNKNAWQVLVDGFATTDSDSNFPTYRLDDAVSLFNASHPSKVTGVAVRSNRVASNAVLSETSLFSAMRIIREQLNGRGLPTGFDGRFVLVVPPALEKEAVEITKSTLQSGSADNNVNYYNGFIDVVGSVYLGAANGGSDTAWYVLALDEMQQSLRYVSLISPKIEREVDFDTKASRVSVDGAWAMGYSNFEFAAGSDGTGV